MSLDPALRARIDSLLAANPVVLFMKGNPRAPACGFSSKAVAALDAAGATYAHVDVLADPEIRRASRPTATGRRSRSCTSAANWSAVPTSSCRWPAAAN